MIIAAIQRRKSRIDWRSNREVTGTTLLFIALSSKDFFNGVTAIVYKKKKLVVKRVSFFILWFSLKNSSPVLKLNSKPANRVKKLSELIIDGT